MIILEENFKWHFLEENFKWHLEAFASELFTFTWMHLANTLKTDLIFLVCSLTKSSCVYAYTPQEDSYFNFI